METPEGFEKEVKQVYGMDLSDYRAVDEKEFLVSIHMYQAGLANAKLKYTRDESLSLQKYEPHEISNYVRALENKCDELKTKLSTEQERVRELEQLVNNQAKMIIDNCPYSFLTEGPYEPDGSKEK